MFYILAVFVGFIISSMVALNGELTATFGVYHATVVIHLVALIVLLCVILIKKQKVKIDIKLPLYYFSGGILGVLTTVFNIYAFPFLSISVLLSLSLFGQSLTSIILDIFHVFNHNQKTNLRTYVGLAFFVLGIIVMIIY